MSITHSHKRCFYVMVLTGLFLAGMGGVLHSPIDVLGGATPKHQAAAGEKLAGEYVLLIAPSLQPTSTMQQQIYDSFVHRTAALPDWHDTSFHIYVPSDHPALCTYARHWADKLAAQHIAVQAVHMNTVMLRSRLRISKYETALVPASFLQADDELPVQQLRLKSYEMR